MIHLRKLAQHFRRVIATLVRVGAPQSVALDSGTTLAQLFGRGCTNCGKDATGVTTVEALR